MKEFVCVTFGQEEAFYKRAKALGYDELVFVYTQEDIKKITTAYKTQLREKISLSLLFGVIVTKHTTSYVQADIHIGLGTTITGLSVHLDYLYYVEYDTRRDGLHQRRGGINHVLFKQCKEKDINLLFGYRDVDTIRPSTIVGRVMQNNDLARKYNVAYQFASMARYPLGMRSPGDVKALALQLE